MSSIARKTAGRGMSSICGENDMNNDDVLDDEEREAIQRQLREWCAYEGIDYDAIKREVDDGKKEST